MPVSRALRVLRLLRVACPARLQVALLNLGLVWPLEARLDDRAVELPADAAEVGEDGRQAPEPHLGGGLLASAQLAQSAVLGVLASFDCLVVGTPG